MKTGAMSKLCASVAVLVVALSTLVVLPGSNEGATQGVSTIYVPVTDGSPVSSGVTVTLTDVHTGKVIPVPYQSPGMFVALNAPPGYYRVDVSAEDHYDEWGAREFRFDGLSSYTVSPHISLTAFPAKQWEWNVTVRDSVTNVRISGATVGFYDPAAGEIVSSGTTNAQGYTVVDMYDEPVAGDVALVVTAKNYRMHYEPVAVTGDDDLTILMTKSVRVTGFITDHDGPASNVVAYLLNYDDGLPWIHRLMKSSMGGSFFEFDATPGAYILCIDADGVAAHTEVLNLGATNIDRSMQLANQTQRVEEVMLQYGADFNSFSLGYDTELSYDDTIPGLRYSDIGNLRLQIDLNFGSPADGAVDGAEVASFVSMLSGYGTKYVTTYGLLAVNSTIYNSALSVTGLTVGLSAGNATTSQEGVAYSYSCAYTSVSALDVGAPDYNADAYLEYDTDSVDRKYVIALPAGYELVDNSTGPTSHVTSTGYLTVTLDPEEHVGGPEHVEMVFGTSEMPIAGAGVVFADTEYAHAVYDDTGENITKYIVRVGEEVNLTAYDSMDPNGNPLEFTWDFGDGSPTVTTYDIETPYTYTSAALGRTVNLTVADVSGLVNWTEITVVCDSRVPVPVISIKDRSVNETTGALEVDQGELVWFNATDSSDDVVSAGDGKGIIDFFELHYGEGNTSGRVYMDDDDTNVSYAWQDAGTYTVVLNVTDVVGHWKNTTLTVMVNDTAAPLPSFVVKNATWGTSLKENEVVVFDANATTDNVDDNDALHFSWFFNDGKGDDSWLNGTGLWNVTHVYDKAGSYAVRVNVTDSAGNWNGYTKTVTISSGPRPNMIIDPPISFDPEVFTEGETGYIIVNMTNRGSAVATDIVLNFYIVNADGTETLLGTWNTILNGTTGEQTTSVAVEGTAVVKFPYKFSDPGSYTVRVNVTSDNQLVVDSNAGVVTVDEAGWKKVALWGGVIAVLVLVPVLLYLRGRWSKRERKGPRREKSKKDKDKDKVS